MRWSTSDKLTEMEAFMRWTPLVVAVFLTLSSGPALAGKKSPKWQDFLAQYQVALTKAGNNAAKVNKLKAIRSDIYKKMDGMERSEFYNYVDQKIEEVKAIIQ